MHEASARDGWADAGTSLDRARDGCGRALLQDVFAFEPPLAGCIAYPRLRGTRSSLAFCTQLVESTGCVVDLERAALKWAGEKRGRGVGWGGVGWGVGGKRVIPLKRDRTSPHDPPFSMVRQPLFSATQCVAAAQQLLRAGGRPPLPHRLWPRRPARSASRPRGLSQADGSTVKTRTRANIQTIYKFFFRAPF